MLTAPLPHATIASLVESLRKISIITFDDSGHLLRAVHAKSHVLSTSPDIVDDKVPTPRGVAIKVMSVTRARA